MVQMITKEDAFGTYIEGHIPFTYQGEKFQTYYKLYGTLEGRTQDPLIIVHGGPGLICNYLFPHADAVKVASIPVIFYDQLGNGRSTHLREKPSEFWVIELFVDELDNLIRYFGIEDSFNVYGHSWGGCVSVEYAIQKQNPGLKRLVLANTLPSTALWGKSTMQLLEKFPADVVEGIKIGMKDPARYYEALKVFHAKHGCTVKPLPAEYTETFEAIFGPDGDTSVTSSSLLDDWTSIGRLHNVKAITLVVNGRDDIAQDYVCAPFFYNINKCKWVRFEGSSHMPFWEERERYIEVLSGFLTETLE